MCVNKTNWVRKRLNPRYCLLTRAGLLLHFGDTYKSCTNGTLQHTGVTDNSCKSCSNGTLQHASDTDNSCKRATVQPCATEWVDVGKGLLHFVGTDSF